MGSGGTGGAVLAAAGGNCVLLRTWLGFSDASAALPGTGMGDFFGSGLGGACGGAAARDGSATGFFGVAAGIAALFLVEAGVLAGAAPAFVDAARVVFLAVVTGVESASARGVSVAFFREAVFEVAVLVLIFFLGTSATATAAALTGRAAAAFVEASRLVW